MIGWISADNLASRLGIRSVHLAQSWFHRTIYYRHDEDEQISVFPELRISATGGLLALKHLSWKYPHKVLYVMCVKVLHLHPETPGL